MGWNRTPVRDEQWKAPVHPTKQVQALEQDVAAGGRHHRVVKGGDGALGRVVLRRRYQRIYAELRWQTNNKQCSKYLCEVSAKSRSANLAAAWRNAHSRGLTETTGAADHT